MSTPRSRVYPGLHKDRNSGMTDAGRIIRDAWVFGILPEGETCEGWTYGRLQGVYDQVHQAWQPYGHLVSRLPDELRERHERIYREAIAEARRQGWDPSLEDEA
jgi:hypothetical protein